MKRRILLVGSARTELALHTDAFAADGETRFGAFTGNTVPGGPLSYAGVAVTRLGGEAILCSAVGDDQYGRDLVKFYEDLGMDTRFVKTVRGGTSPLGVTAERADGERRSYRSSVLSEAIDGDLVEEAFTSLPDAVWLSLEIPVSRHADRTRRRGCQALHRHRAALGAEQSRGSGRAGEDHPCGNLHVPRGCGRRVCIQGEFLLLYPLCRGRGCAAERAVCARDDPRISALGKDGARGALCLHGDCPRGGEPITAVPTETEVLRYILEHEVEL